MLDIIVASTSSYTLLLGLIPCPPAAPEALEHSWGLKDIKTVGMDGGARFDLVCKRCADVLQLPANPTPPLPTPPSSGHSGGTGAAGPHGCCLLAHQAPTTFTGGC